MPLASAAAAKSTKAIQTASALSRWSICSATGVFENMFQSPIRIWTPKRVTSTTPSCRTRGEGRRRLTTPVISRM